MSTKIKLILIILHIRIAYLINHNARNRGRPLEHNVCFSISFPNFEKLTHISKVSKLKVGKANVKVTRNIFFSSKFDLKSQINLSDYFKCIGVILNCFL